MKNQKEMNENEKILGGVVKWYRENITEIINNTENEETLKKIYTVAKTLKDIQIEKERG